MRAVVFDRHGAPEVLRVAELPVPRAGPGQVRARAVGIQPFDALVRRGEMDVGVVFPQRLGNEFSGVVDDVGAEVSGWSIGDAVLGWAPPASLAEHVVADADAVVAKPAGMAWDVAGALGASGQTALTALRELRVGAVETLLVHAAAGGVGTMAVQLASVRGAAVIGTASAASHDHLLRMGAIPVCYGPGLVERVRAVAPDGVTAALDAVGGQALRDSLALVADRTRIATLVDHDLAARLGVRGVRAERSAAQLRELVGLWERGALHVTVRAEYPLERVVEAHRDVEAGHGPGKVVVTIEE